MTSRHPARRWTATQRAWWRTVLDSAADGARPGVLHRVADAQRDLLTGLVAVACGGGDPGPDVQTDGRRRQERFHRGTAQLVAAQSRGWAEAWARAARPPG